MNKNNLRFILMLSIFPVLVYSNFILLSLNVIDMCPPFEIDPKISSSAIGFLISGSYLKANLPLSIGFINLEQVGIEVWWRWCPSLMLILVNIFKLLSKIPTNDRLREAYFFRNLPRACEY